MAGKIAVERTGSVGWLAFDHPERRNAISVDMWRAIPAAVAGLSADDEVRVVVMRGAGDIAFVSGADISEFEHSRSGDATLGYDVEVGQALSALLQLEKPLVAAIRGFCFGGGVALALTADLRYAGDDALFSIPAARLGLGYRMPAFALLVDAVGASAAKEILFTARRFRAEEALRMGLVNEVLPAAGLDAAVSDIARRIAGNAPLTVRSVKLMAKELARESGERDLEAVEDSVRACFGSEDYMEGVRAFLEKRRPRFSGR